MSEWSYERMAAVMEEYAPDPKKLDAAGRTRLRIIEAAAELFAEGGYRRTSVDEISRHAHLSKATVYAHFKSKGDVLFHAIAHEKKKVFAQFLPLFDPEVPARKRLKGWLGGLLEMIRRMPITSKLMRGDRDLALAMRDLPADEMEKLEPIRFDFLGELIRQAIAPEKLTNEQVRERVRVLTGLMFFTLQITEPHVHAELTPQRFAQVLAEMVIDGLVPRSGRDAGTEGEES